jgi:predicted ABC-type transport system involved in lysophospholipase L1 biosynthesis ATPase subunit
MHHLLPQCTALENVLVPTLVRRGGSTDEERERALRLLDVVGLAQRADHRPAQLSGGECQRVAVVRALINRPLLLLADEPTGSLDGAAADHLAELFAELERSEGVTLIAVTHSQRLAQRLARVLTLTEGRLTERT